MGPSSAGAFGYCQFLPNTWAAYGVDGDGDGIADPYNFRDCIPAMAGYLMANGAPADMHRALYAYNHLAPAAVPFPPPQIRQRRVP